MKILIIKTSSLGDIVHCFEGFLEAYNQQPHIKFDWLVEDVFSELPTFLPNTRKIYQSHFRKWRKNLFKKETWRALKALVQSINLENYDLIIDLQGLMRTALFAKWLRFNIAHIGYDTPYEKLARLFYSKRVGVNTQHRPTQTRYLLANVLNYKSNPDSRHFLINENTATTPHKILFFPNTSLRKKTWHKWDVLAKTLTSFGIDVSVLNGSIKEYETNSRLITNASILKPYSLNKTKDIISKATLVIGVDTGLTHLACMMHIPCISIYGKSVTSPNHFAIRHKTHRIIEEKLETLSETQVLDVVWALLDSK